MSGKLVLSFLFLAFHSALVAQLPTANFTSNVQTGCSPLTVQFTDQSTGSPFSWNWDLGNGQFSTAPNPIGIYTQPGIYTVTLIVKNVNGLDEETKVDYITVYPAPVAAFTADMTLACVPATIQFTDQSTAPAGAGNIVSWEWNFGDGSPPSTSQNPSHVFTATGYYSISLKVTSSTGCSSFKAVGRYIRVVSGIDADFSFSQPNTCQAPFVINFQDQSSGPGTLSYTWSFGNGGPGSTIANPTATYNAAGTYPVQLSVQSNLGCSGTITKNITIAGKTTDFVAPASICVGQSITFQNNSSPAPQSSSWDFGDGTTSSQINPIKTFFVGGSYQVRLINNYGNCVDSVTKTITVTTQPVVSFTANDSTACKAPFTVQFTDTSPAASTWLWDFGDGSPTSTSQNPSHTYTANGVYSVTLNITLPGGCSNTITKTQYIKIAPTTINISNAPDGGCLPFTYSPIAVIQSVDSIISYSWNLGEPGATYTTLSPSHTYTSVGNYTISLTITTQTGCTQTITIPNGVRTGTSPTVNFSFTPNNVCASTPVQFTDLSVTSPGAFVQWFWNFGDSSDISNLQNPSHVFQDTGLLNVRLVVSNNGCRDSISLPIQILPPVAKFGYTVNCNNRMQVTFLDSSLANPIYGPVTYEWRMGDPANTIIFGTTPPTFTYPALGTYQATLIVTNGSCSYQTTREVKLFNEAASFTINKNPVCKSEVFTLSATGNDANIFDYTWTIGSTVIADTTRTLDYNISTYGSYDVTLTIEDINGCLNTTTIPNFITVSGPVASFTNGPGACINSPVSFTDQSTPTGTVTQWIWNFGDGNQQTYSSGPFTHAYTQTGIFSVSLTVKDNANCTDTILMPNSVVITSPKAEFRADTFYCPLSPLQFVDTSSGSGLTHQWYFGDGGTSTVQNPTHAYPLGDVTYNVKLVITDLVGCKDSIIKNQYIKIRSPKAAFSMIDSTGVCIPLVTSFSFMGSDYESYYWDFGDGGTSTGNNPSHFYNAYGSFIPKLYVEGPGGCIDSAQSIVRIYDPAVDMKIAATPLVACDSLTANFTLTVPPGFKFALLFGDGLIDSSQQVILSHKYKSPGGYTPVLIVYDKFGCEAVTFGQSIIVNGAIPLFAKDKKEFCDQGQVNFTNYTLNYDPVISTVWDFGDGNSSTATNPSHIYSAPGTYVIKLTVTTQNLCARSTYDTVRVYRTPVINITGKDTICVNNLESFNALLQQPDTAIQWQWSFGNGNNSQTQNPSTTYTSTGDFSIVAIATNKLGCADTATHKINVVPLPTAIPASDPITILSGGSATLNMTYTGSIVSYNWLPAQNLTCTNCPQPTANPQFTTKYVVRVQDTHGCSNTGNVTVKVVCNGQNFFIPNTFSPNGDGSNDVFYPRGTGLFSAKTLRIFNRWGEIVFERQDFPVNNASVGWDGTWKGKKANSDVYIYQLEIYCQNGELIKYNGNITLIR
jgi:gliding motility-associated-like protein